MTKVHMIDDWQKAHQLAAEMLLIDNRYLPIFLRIEREIAQLVEQQDALARAETVLNQKAIGASSLNCCSSDAPEPYRSRPSA